LQHYTKIENELRYGGEVVETRENTQKRAMVVREAGGGMIEEGSNE
jgi:hypothetical protein